MKENVVKKVIVAVVILIMLLPILIDVFVNSSLKTIKYGELTKTIDGTTNYDFALVYVAPSSDKDIKDQKKEVKEVVGNENYKSVATGKELKSYYLDSSKLSNEEHEDIFTDDSQDTAYMFVVNGEVTKIVEGTLKRSELVDYVEFYSANGEEIAEDLINYSVPEDAKEFGKLIKDKNKVTMFVLGRDNCFYCNQFKIVYSTVAEEYGVEDSIYYIDSNSYDSEEYGKIMDSGLMIPAECSDTGEEIKLQAGFNTPLILFTKNNKTVDCMKGYTNKANLITKLKTVGIIEEEK